MNRDEYLKAAAQRPEGEQRPPEELAPIRGLDEAALRALAMRHTVHMKPDRHSADSAYDDELLGRIKDRRQLGE